MKARENDLAELRLMSHDANHAKEVAKADLQRYSAQVEEERAAREKELTEMRQLVEAKKEMHQRMEKRDKQRGGEDDDDPEGRGGSGRRNSQGYVGRAQEEKKLEENTEKVTTYEEAFRKIKDATGVTDVNEVIQKFLTQEDTHKSLQAMIREAQSRIDALTEEKASAKARVEEIKYSATGSAGSHRIVDEFETQLGEANTKCERNKQKYERIAKVLINVKAGIEHLSDKLENVRSDMPPVQLTDDTIVDVLTVCEHKLTKLLEAVSLEQEGSDYEDEPETAKNVLAAGAPAATGMYGASQAELSAYNVRIKLPDPNTRDDGDSDDDLGDDDAGEVLDRNEIKKRASALQESKVKKNKRRVKKKASGESKAERTESAGVAATPAAAASSSGAGAISAGAQPTLQ